MKFLITTTTTFLLLFMNDAVVRSFIISSQSNLLQQGRGKMLSMMGRPKGSKIKASKLYEITVDNDELMEQISKSVFSSDKGDRKIMMTDNIESMISRIELNSAGNSIIIESNDTMKQGDMINILKTIQSLSFQMYMDYVKEEKTDKNLIRSIGTGLYSISLVSPDTDIDIVLGSERNNIFDGSGTNYGEEISSDGETSKAINSNDSFSGTRLIVSLKKEDLAIRLVDDLLWRFSELMECYALVSGSVIKVKESASNNI